MFQILHEIKQKKRGSLSSFYILKPLDELTFPPVK